VEHSINEGNVFIINYFKKIFIMKKKQIIMGYWHYGETDNSGSVIFTDIQSAKTFHKYFEIYFFGCKDEHLGYLEIGIVSEENYKIIQEKKLSIYDAFVRKLLISYHVKENHSYKW
jgi:hypothetical protein